MVRRQTMLIVVLLAGVAAGGNAQRAGQARAGVARRIPRAYAPVVSAIIPGAGQLMQGRDRSIAYAAIEVLAWWKFGKDVSERTKQVKEYKDLARRVARVHFAPNGRDGDWTYYESMRDYLESGDYSKSDAALVPETDPTTFNGYTWQVIKGTTPATGDSVADMNRALAEYSVRAVRPELQWSWGNAQFHWDLFKRTTEKRNDANNAATFDLTIIALNHLLSMVDAFAAFRLETHPQANGRTALGATVKW